MRQTKTNINNVSEIEVWDHDPRNKLKTLQTGQSKVRNCNKHAATGNLRFSQGDARLNWEKNLPPPMSCIVSEDRRIHSLTRATLMEASSWTSEADDGRDDGEEQRKLMDHIVGKGYVEFVTIAWHIRLFRSNGENWRNHRLETKSVSNTRPKFFKIRKKRKKHNFSISNRCHLKNAELVKPFEKTEGDVCSKKTSSRIKKDTEHYSQSKVLQLHRW